MQSCAITCRWTSWRWQHCRGRQDIVSFVGLPIRIRHLLIRSHATSRSEKAPKLKQITPSFCPSRFATYAREQPPVYGTITV